MTAESGEPAAPVLPPHFDEEMLGATLEVLARELFSARASASVRQIAHEALLVTFCLPGVSAGVQGVEDVLLKSFSYEALGHVILSIDRVSQSVIH